MRKHRRAERLPEVLRISLRGAVIVRVLFALPVASIGYSAPNDATVPFQ